MKQESYAALMAKKAELEKKIEAARAREIRGVITRIRDAIAVYGITADQLFEAEESVPQQRERQKRIKKTSVYKTKMKHPAKYADDKGNAWSGFGRMPGWLKAYQENGQSIEDFRVHPEAA